MFCSTIENTAKLPSVDRPTSRGIDQADPNEVNHWVRELQTIEEKTDTDVVSQAFTNLLSYEPVDPSSNHFIRIGKEGLGREELYSSMCESTATMSSTHERSTRMPFVSCGMRPSSPDRVWFCGDHCLRAHSRL